MTRETGARGVIQDYHQPLVSILFQELPETVAFDVRVNKPVMTIGCKRNEIDRGSDPTHRVDRRTKIHMTILARLAIDELGINRH